MLCHLKLSSQLVTLRNIEPNDDLASYLDWLSDVEVNQFLEIRFNMPQSITELWGFIDDINNSSDTLLFGVFDTKLGVHIGNIKLGPINAYHNVAEIGLLIGNKSFWGQNYGSEAIRLVCEYAFEVLGLAKVTAGCYAENTGSRKAFIKQGFKQEGVLCKQWFCNGNRQDGYLFGKLNTRII